MVAETVESIEALTTGQRLRAAREARNMERSDVARWLKLDVKLIKAIEEDDEEPLPGPVFIAGYIRSYAKLVDLPADQLVQEFTKSHGLSSPKIAKLPEPVPGRMGKVAESLPKRFSVATNSHPANVKWFVMISAAIFFVGIAGWIAVIVGDHKKSEIASLDEKITVPAEEQPAAAASPSAAQVESDTTAAGGEAQDVVEQSAADQGQQTASQPTPKRITVPLPLRKLERSDPGVVAIMGEEELANQPKESIAVHFSADSWVDIRDATGKRLIRSLGVAGATKEVEGVAPFQVLIGYGPGVELTYNGDPYDFSKFQGKQEVARFTLNPPDDKQNKSQQD